MSLLLHAFKRTQRGLGVVALSVNLATAMWALATVYHGPGEPGGVLVSQMGNWPAPFGITLALDPLSGVMLSVSGAVMLAVYVYCLFQLPKRFEGGYFHVLYHLLLMGVNWSFVTGDLFNLFVAFEILLMASYAILCVGTTRLQMRHAYKYVILNLIASTLFVTACGLLYGQLGTLNMAEITRIAQRGELPAGVVPIAGLLAIVFTAKTAGFPLWYWLPTPTPRSPRRWAAFSAACSRRSGRTRSSACSS